MGKIGRPTRLEFLIDQIGYRIVQHREEYGHLRDDGVVVIAIVSEDGHRQFGPFIFRGARAGNIPEWAFLR